MLRIYFFILSFNVQACALKASKRLEKINSKYLCMFLHAFNKYIHSMYIKLPLCCIKAIKPLSWPCSHLNHEILTEINNIIITSNNVNFSKRTWKLDNKSEKQKNNIFLWVFNRFLLKNKTWNLILRQRLAIKLCNFLKMWYRGKIKPFLEMFLRLF